MLFKKNTIEVGDIVSLKLTSSDEIIGKFESESDKGVILHRPFIIAPSPQGMALIPFIITANEKYEVELRHSHIMGIVKSRDEVRNAYIQNTSNLVAATKMPNVK